MSKIKILHIIKTLDLGGAEQNLLNLVRAGDGRRVDIHVAYSSGGEFEQQFRDNGVRLFKFSNDAHKLKSPVSFLVIARLAAYVMRNRIDIIHTHTFNAHVWGAAAAKITGAKLVEHVHDFRYLDPDDFKRRRGASRQYKYVKFLKNVSDKVIVLTKQNRDFLIKNGLYAPEKVEEIQNGIPLSDDTFNGDHLRNELRRKMGIGEKDFVIVTPCRIAPEKNLELIMRIAPKVCDKCSNAIFLIYGDGPLLKEFREQCKDHTIKSKVRMMGFHKEMYDLLRAADVFLLPSFLELHSIAALEAMSMKVPVVISKDVGCNNEFINNWDNGVLLDPFSDDDWADTLIKLAENKELREIMGKRGYQLCRERFDIIKNAKAIEGIYAELDGK